MSQYNPVPQQPQPPQPPPPRRQTGPRWLPIAAGATAGLLGLIVVIGAVAGGGATTAANPAPAATSQAPAPKPTSPAPKPTSQAPKPSASPTKSQSPIEADGTYDTAEDLYNAAVAAGLTPGEWQADEESEANSTSSGNNGDDEASFYVYADNKTLRSDLNEAHAGDNADVILAGKNWMIVTNEVAEIQPELGGENPTWADKKPKPKPKPKPAAHEVSKRQWAKVVKNPDRYKGKRYIIYGEVSQFDSATGDSNFLADTAHTNTTSYGYFDGENSWMEGKASKLEDLVEDDVFKATVTVLGSYSYDTQIGGNTTVPHLKVDKIKQIGNNG